MNGLAIPGIENHWSCGLFAWVVFFVLFIVLVFFLHDSMVHQQFENKMTEIGKQLQEFHQDNRRLPNLNEFLELVAGSRNLPDQLIDYDPTMVLDDSPGDTILAFTPLCRQWILPERHAVIKLDFTLIWVTADELQVMLEKRQQFYNQNSISDIS